MFANRPPIPIHRFSIVVDPPSLSNFHPCPCHPSSARVSWGLALPSRSLVTITCGPRAGRRRTIPAWGGRPGSWRSPLVPSSQSGCSKSGTSRRTIYTARSMCWKRLSVAIKSQIRKRPKKGTINNTKSFLAFLALKGAKIPQALTNLAEMKSPNLVTKISSQTYNNCVWNRLL